jgi:hypothetical protein
MNCYFCLNDTTGDKWWQNGFSMEFQRKTNGF